MKELSQPIVWVLSISGIASCFGLKFPVEKSHESIATSRIVVTATYYNVA